MPADQPNGAASTTPWAIVYAFWPMVHASRCHILDAIRFERLPMTLNSAGETATIGEHA
ncbi:MAG: hypothetical protein QOE89_329, partial [Pseudonocardiales bacterium]|nr:hypothetical protein [Pseudonocardiales bacterium]